MSAPTYTAEELATWFPCKCPRCGWQGLSRDAAGGGPIADTGDFADPVCPKCLGDDSTKDEDRHWIRVKEAD